MFIWIQNLQMWTSPEPILRKLLSKPQNAASVSGELSLLTTCHRELLCSLALHSLGNTAHTAHWATCPRSLSMQQARQPTEVRAELNKLVSQNSLKSSPPGPQIKRDRFKEKVFESHHKSTKTLPTPPDSVCLDLRLQLLIHFRIFVLNTSQQVGSKRR